MAILDKIIAAAVRFFKKKSRPARRVNSGGRKRAGTKRPLKIAKKVRAKKKVVLKSKKVKGVKKPAVKGVKKKAPPAKAASPGERIGEITHYFSRIQVVVIKLTKGLKVGEKIRIKGSSNDFVQTVKSLQIESVDVKAAKKGELVGLKVQKIAKEGDLVFRVK